ncbi:MAG: hypothetical protein NDI91_16470 [Sulfuritalea sp.]|nr:hypothetical protein [Sulfuritalea sp.]
MSGGNDFTMAMFNKGRAEAAAESAASWKNYARELEQKCVELRAKTDAELCVVGEMLDEIANDKPRVISDPKNKPARDALRQKVRRLSEVRLIDKDPLSF